ncbi:lysozyme [Halothiobacillus neapolitanus]|uniref:Lysozyme n=1 Tax=Halothiobacillus neapolitanus (strain ATCC 23641 / DSM 15147 / CIP 104769 / NCIMB 8539 / c2) TaxID=555778 RepID=D0KWZ0_HALNC|nr:hypothetical protein [Halothiobacillus neapolitanus]ACX97110.1 hypothetical protein Hneap_2300 [Halothiobacillus neapolitanus c2]TDN57490.1 hypothetical protein C8D83_1137 [Halothiobacillus neapolitanus]
MKRNVSIDKGKAPHKVAVVLILVLVGCNSGSSQSQSITNPPNTPDSTLPPYQPLNQPGQITTSHVLISPLASPRGKPKKACANACLAIPPGKTQAQVIEDFEAQNNCVICPPIAEMSVSVNYLNAMLPTFEGYVPQYYNDSKCNCTAGVGHLVQHGQCPANLAAPGKQKTPQATDACVKNTWWKSPKAFPGASISQAQITSWEKEDIAWAENRARNLFANAHITHVTQNEFDGLVDLIYNGGLYKSYHIAAYIKAGDFEAAIKSNTRRGNNNHLPVNRVEFENSGLAQGELCK